MCPLTPKTIVRPAVGTVLIASANDPAPEVFKFVTIYTSPPRPPSARPPYPSAPGNAGICAMDAAERHEAMVKKERSDFKAWPLSPTNLSSARGILSNHEGRFASGRTPQPKTRELLFVEHFSRRRCPFNPQEVNRHAAGIAAKKFVRSPRRLGFPNLVGGRA